MVFELLGTAEVLPDLAPDQRFRAFVLLVYGYKFCRFLYEPSRMQVKHTFERKHEIVERVLVLFVSLGVALFLVFVNCNLHELDRTLVPKRKLSLLASR